MRSSMTDPIEQKSMGELSPVTSITSDSWNHPSAPSEKRIAGYASVDDGFDFHGGLLYVHWDLYVLNIHQVDGKKQTAGRR